MERKIRFNTGRQYSKEGQIIEAEEFGTPLDLIDWLNDDLKQDSQYIIFHDITRQIKGKIHFCKLSEMEIMKAYDEGEYDLI
jgi:hypothetical protein